MKVRLRIYEAELIADVLRERISLMKHAGVSYTGTLKHRIAYDKIREAIKKQVRSKEDQKRLGGVRQQGRVDALR